MQNLSFALEPTSSSCTLSRKGSSPTIHGIEYGTELITKGVDTMSTYITEEKISCDP